MDQIESLKVASDRLSNRAHGDGRFRAVWHLYRISMAGRLLYWAIAMGVPWIVLATSTELILTRQRRSSRHVIAIVLGVNILAAIAASMTVMALEYLILSQRFDQLSFAALYVYTFIIGLTVSALVTPFRLRDRYGAETARLAGGTDQETKQPAADDLLFKGAAAFGP